MSPLLTTYRILCLHVLGIFTAATLLVGCASPDVTRYATERPALELDQFFNGKIIAHGIFQNRSGEVVRRFTVDMDGKWEGNQGVLDERFTYSDGKTERRIWRLTKSADAATAARPMTWQAWPADEPPATPFNGPTPSNCRWMALSTRCSLMTGCT